MRGGQISLDADGRAEYFRQCNGSESLHPTVWTGRSLKGRRLWHGYYHLNYDTVPTCKGREAFETEQEN